MPKIGKYAGDKKFDFKVDALESDALRSVSINNETCGIHVSKNKTKIENLEVETLTVKSDLITDDAETHDDLIVADDLTVGGHVNLSEARYIQWGLHNSIQHIENDGFRFITRCSETGTVNKMIELYNLSAGSTTDNFGGRIQFVNESDAGLFNTTGTFDFISTDVTGASSDGEFVWRIDVANSLTQKMKLDTDGLLVYGNVTDDGGDPTANAQLANKQYVDKRDNSQVKYASIPKTEIKPSVLNSWYPLNYNHSMGTLVTAADFQDQDLVYSNIFQASSAVKLKHINLSCYFNSAVPWELALYDVTLPADGSAAASTIAQIGSDIDINSGSAVTAYRYYKVSLDLSDYALAAEHGVYLIGRYTSGSGKKGATIAGTLEIING